MDYDVIVIGGGNAGQGAAFRTARGGKTTALVDKGDVGGLCALRGCNPKKVMMRASEVLDEVRRASIHGITTGPVSIGAQLCSPTAGDAIHVMALAIRFGMTRAQLEDMVYGYPTPSSTIASMFTPY